MQLASLMVLQWGHGGEAVESYKDSHTAYVVWLLQWGHGGEAVESCDMPRFVIL